MLRIRIRDPLFFLPLDPDPIFDDISESLTPIFGIKNAQLFAT